MHGAVGQRGTGPLLHAPSLQDALQLVALGLSRSLNWGAALPGGQPSALPNRASLFVRFSIYDAQRRGLASLHLVDLVGTAPLGGNATAAALDYERRCLSQHLLCFNRVVSELSQQQQAAQAGTKLLSARDSKLTQLLAPYRAPELQPRQSSRAAPAPGCRLAHPPRARSATPTTCPRCSPL